MNDEGCVLAGIIPCIKGFDEIKRVYDPRGISPTITAKKGGNHEAKIVVYGERDN